VLNLPSSEGYKPSLPRVMLIRPDGLTAAGCLTFFDDGRVYGPNKRIAQQALCHICANVQCYGNQEAARKRRPCQLRPGAWCGGVVYADQELPRSFLTQNHWDRLLMTLEWMFIQAEQNVAVPRQSILEKLGFLVFASMAYPFMVPYLKSLYNSVEEWCLNRDKDGYAIEDQLVFHEPDPDIEAILIEKNIDLQSLDTDNEAPATVNLVPQVKSDTTSLQRLISLPSPIMLVLRPVLDPIWVVYGFGDSAREGTGRLIVRQSARDHVRVRMAFWCSKNGEKTSNNREFRNLKDMVIDEAKLGSLTGHEVFLGTDRQVADNVWHKGISKELNMYEMMLELREAAIKLQFMLHFVHVAGTRMIEVGVGGLSRAELDVGKLTNPTTIRIPMHLSPVQRNDLLHTWISSWISEPLHFAEPHHCFEEAQQSPTKPLPCRRPYI
jgi:hypothetical protein